MDQLNANAGLIVLIVSILFTVILGGIVWLLISIRQKIAVQRLKFIGQFSADPDTRKMVANITVSNRSLNDVTITELGLRNGKVNFNYTDVYKKQNNLNKDARVVVGQRDAIRFVLTAEELAKSLIQDYKGKIVLNSVFVYAMDSTGISYKGKVSDIKKLLAEIAKNGVDYLPPAFETQNTQQPKPAAAKPAGAPPAANAAPSAPAGAPNPVWRAPNKGVQEVPAPNDRTKKV